MVGERREGREGSKVWNGGLKKPLVWAEGKGRVEAPVELEEMLAGNEMEVGVGGREAGREVAGR